MCFEIGDKVEFTFDNAYVKAVRLVFDSDFIRECQKDFQVKQYPNRFHISKDAEKAVIPPSLVKGFTLQICKNGQWENAIEERNNWQRIRKIAINEEISGLRFIGNDTYGAEQIRIYSIDCV